MPSMSPTAPARRAHLDAVAAAAILIREGIEPILQFNCRDSNRIALQSELMGAAALGIRNLLLLKGDDPKQGDQPDAKPVFDYDTAALTKVAVDDARQGRTADRRKVGGKADFFIAAADVPIDPPAGWEPKSLKGKIEAGCEFVQTQFCMDAGVARRYMARLAEHGVKLPFLIGISPLRSAKSARWMKEKLYGTIIPDATIARLESAERSRRRRPQALRRTDARACDHPGRRRRPHHGARQRGRDRRCDPRRGGDQAGEVSFASRSGSCPGRAGRRERRDPDPSYLLVRTAGSGSPALACPGHVWRRRTNKKRPGISAGPFAFCVCELTTAPASPGPARTARA